VLIHVIFLFWQVVFSDRGEYLDCDGVLEDMGSVFFICGYTPTVSGADIMLVLSDNETDVSFHEIAGLFIHVRVHRKGASALQLELGHEGSVAITQGFHMDAGQRRFGLLRIVFLEHRLCLHGIGCLA